MNSPNPLLRETELPPFEALLPEQVNPAIDRLLADYRAGIEAIVADPGPRRWDGVMRPQEEFEDRLASAWAPIGHLHAVCDTPAWREAYTQALVKITEFEAELGQNRGLYEAVLAVRQDPEFNWLHRDQRKIVEDALRDFRLSGVALEEPARSRFRAIATELSVLSTEFEQAVMDATDGWYLDFPDAAPLAGIPDSALVFLAQAARDADLAGYRVTLHQPSYHAVMTYAQDRALRARVYEAYATRASDAGPLAARFDNTARIEKIMALRHEAAQMLGYPNAAAESVATKMAGEPRRVLGFLRDLAARVKPLAEREVAELRAFATQQLGLTTLEPWDVAYAAEKMREMRYALNEEEIKPYFPVEQALQGLFAVAERLFGVRFAARSGVPTWHPDVRYFDLLDTDGQAFAGVYFDLFARLSKRPGAWMDVCRNRRRHAGGLQRPVAFLTCNFAPPAGGQPSLLTHDEAMTLFHEFGHGLHHLLTEIDYPSIAGISGVEWDAVELPSQFMENFCWSRDTLHLFARHWQTGAPLPDALFEKMQAARHYHAGLFLARQLEFALFDFRLHLEYDPARGSRMFELLESVRAEVAVIQPPAWHRLPHAFGHIFAGGYAAGYYSYLWAEVLSADAFSQFEEHGVLDRHTGERFRRSILGVGGARPALESFIEFRGREPHIAPFLRSYGFSA